MRIHIATSDGQTEYNEAEARTLWQQGSIPREAKYWKEGMADWQPLASHFSAKDAPFNPYASNPDMDSTPGMAEGLRYSYIKSPHTLTRVVLVMLALSIVSDLVKIGSDAMQLSLLGSGFTDEAGMANDTRQKVVATAWQLVYIATGIPFLMWIHRINVNCRGFGAQGMLLTPGWAVGSFFIPIMNLFRPYQAMKQVWQASQDPEHWHSRDSSPTVALWWTLWIISCVMGQISFRVSVGADTIEAIQKSTVLSIAEGLVSITLTVAAILLVRGIYRMQEALVNQKPLTQAGTPCGALPGKARPPKD